LKEKRKAPLAPLSSKTGEAKGKIKEMRSPLRIYT